MRTCLLTFVCIILCASSLAAGSEISVYQAGFYDPHFLLRNDTCVIFEPWRPNGWKILATCKIQSEYIDSRIKVLSLTPFVNPLFYAFSDVRIEYDSVKSNPDSITVRLNFPGLNLNEADEIYIYNFPMRYLVKVNGSEPVFLSEGKADVIIPNETWTAGNYIVVSIIPFLEGSYYRMQYYETVCYSLPVAEFKKDRSMTLTFPMLTRDVVDTYNLNDEIVYLRNDTLFWKEYALKRDSLFDSSEAIELLDPAKWPMNSKLSNHD